MDESTRLHYLHAMGIDVWLPKFSSDTHTLKLLENQLPISEATLLPHSQEQNLLDSSLLHNDSTSSPNLTYDSWELLHAEVQACQACNLCQNRTQTVFGIGDRQADWLLLGGAPEAIEEEHGEPFVGNAGQLLNEMLLALGMRREQVYMTTVVKCRPSQNRDPHAIEINACQEFLSRQISLIQPKIILVIGHKVAQYLLQQSDTHPEHPKQQLMFLGIPLFVVPHPTHLLSTPLEKSNAWEELQFAWINYQNQSLANIC